MKIGQTVVYKGFYATIQRVLKTKYVIRLFTCEVKTVSQSSVTKPLNL